MESLGLLEKKVVDLIALVKKLKADNDKLEKENAKLSSKVKDLEGSAKALGKDMQAIEKEHELTKVFVGDLIKSISSLVEGDSK